MAEFATRIAVRKQPATPPADQVRRTLIPESVAARPLIEMTTWLVRAPPRARPADKRIAVFARLICQALATLRAAVTRGTPICQAETCPLPIATTIDLVARPEKALDRVPTLVWGAPPVRLLRARSIRIAWARQEQQHPVIAQLRAKIGQCRAPAAAPLRVRTAALRVSIVGADAVRPRLTGLRRARTEAAHSVIFPAGRRAPIVRQLRA